MCMCGLLSDPGIPGKLLLKKGGASAGTVLALAASFPVQLARRTLDFAIGDIREHGATFVPGSPQRIPGATGRPCGLVLVDRHDRSL